MTGTSPRTPESLSVYGSLLLRGAIAAAQHDERDTALELLTEADDAARQLGADANLRWTAFGAVNAQMHQVNIAVTLGDAGTAVDVARRINLSTIAVTERKASLLIDTARQYSTPGAPRSQIPDAIIVAPATYNTINKWALGISDTFALGVLAEITSLGVPIVVLPFVNSALASRPPFRRSIDALRAEGVRILLGPGGVEPHPPRTGGSLIDSYPWHLALDEADHLVSLRAARQ